MTKWIEGIENPVVWAVMFEDEDGMLKMCKSGSYGSHSMIYVSQSTARTQMKRLERDGVQDLKIVRYTVDLETLNWRKNK